jgi:hypothetical protein
MRKKFLTRSRYLSIVFAAGIAASVAGIGTLLASDHMDTPEVELNPRMDINDVYAFPGSSADRVALVLTTSSPIAGQNASFDPNLLYQIKIDNGGDANEDLVIQITFNSGTGAAQQVRVVGPIAPSRVGTENTLVNSSSAVEGSVNSILGSPTGVQVFAGLRADPFFIDFEQFFNILPDRRPSTGALSSPSTPCNCTFRNPGVDLLRPFNALAIVIELPKSQLLSSTAADAKFGVWATISR